jgi:hypothetical protein
LGASTAIAVVSGSAKRVELRTSPGAERVRESLRQAVENGVLVSEHATGSIRFRHTLLAEAIYGTIRSCPRGFRRSSRAPRGDSRSG